MDQGETVKPNLQDTRLKTRRSALKIIAGAIVTTLTGGRDSNINEVSEAKTPAENTKEYFLEFIFPKESYTEEERDKEIDKAEFWRQYFLNPVNIGKRQSINSLHQDINTAFQTALRNLWYMHKPPVDNKWRQIMAGLILVESSGNPKAISRDIKGNPIAYGLCQLKPEVAKQLASELKLPWNQNQLLEKEVNLQLGIYHLMKMFRLYPDCSLAIWSYHLGPGNMDAAIRKYVYSKAKDKDELEKAKDIFGNLETPGTSVFTRKYQLTAAKLQHEEGVARVLIKRGATQDDTFNYLYKVVGATLALV